VVVVNTRFRFPLGGIEGDSTTETLAVLLIELNLPSFASDFVLTPNLAIAPILTHLFKIVFPVFSLSVVFAHFTPGRPFGVRRLFMASNTEFLFSHIKSISHVGEYVNSERNTKLIEKVGNFNSL
jgi:hypothetical protein